MDKAAAVQPGKRLLAALAIICALLTLLILGDDLLNAPAAAHSEESLRLSAGWQLAEDGLPGGEVKLPYAPTTKETRTAELYRELPQTSFEQAVLTVTGGRAFLAVELDGVVLYESSYSPRRFGGRPPTLNEVVLLPSDFGGRRLTLRLVSAPGDSSAPGGLQSVVLTDGADPAAFRLSRRLPLFFLCMAGLTCGVLLLALSVLRQGIRFLGDSFFMLGIFALAVSLRQLCFAALPPFSQNPPFAVDFGYICGFTAAIALPGFLYTVFVRHKAVLYYSRLIYMAFYLLALLLRLFGIADFDTLSWVLWVLLLPVLVLLHRLPAELLSKDNRRQLPVAFGLGLLAVGALLDLLWELIFHTGGSMLLLALIPACCCMASGYLETLRRHRKSLAKRTPYKALAYTDHLTGLRNRLGFEEDMAQLAEKLDRCGSVVIANIDVNSFKRINDLYGHIMGDRALREVASALKLAFGEFCSCYRMGGDEFCLVARDQDRQRLEALLHRVNDELDRAIPEFPVSLAFGIAEYNHFLHKDLMEVYSTADARMYEHKRSSKQLDGIHK